MKVDKIKKISNSCKTPSYVFDLDVLRARVQKIEEILGKEIKVCYAMKANPFLIQALEPYVSGFEVCSPGEFAICERCDISMDQIVLSGVYKEKNDILAVMKKNGDKGTFTVESLVQLSLLQECAKANDIVIKVLLRVSSGNQFGMDFGTIKQIVIERENYPNLHILGLQYYSGTQKKKSGIIERELELLDSFCETLKKDCEYQVEELEYGPGFYVPYFQTEKEEQPEETLAVLVKKLEEMKYSGKITLEIGRYIAASCGYYFTTVVEQKTVEAQRYCIVDGGIHHINYYGQTMAMKLPQTLHIAREQEGKWQPWNICGSLCTVADVIVKQLPLQNLQIGDILVFENLGAYSITEGIYLFLSRDLPTVYFYSEENGLKTVRDRIVTNTINSI